VLLAAGNVHHLPLFTQLGSIGKQQDEVFLTTSGVNFTNILRASLAPKAFCHKITNPNCKHIKAAQGTLV
jgi:hypothetical protein